MRKIIKNDKISAMGQRVERHEENHTHFGSMHSRILEAMNAATIGGTTTIVDFAPQKKRDFLLRAIEKRAIMNSKKGAFDENKDIPRQGKIDLLYHFGARPPAPI